jgi:hypothetical protein
MCLLDVNTHNSLLDNFNYEVDPDFTDAVIFNDVNSYMSSQNNKVNSSLHKEITEHNKKIKLCTKSATAATKELKQHLKVGSVLWKSASSFLTVTEIYNIDLTAKNSKPIARAVTNKNRVIYLHRGDILKKALYIDRPRSYKELKIPNI